ncbi:MAG: PAS domain S-box protein [Bacteroidales bacterium]
MEKTISILHLEDQEADSILIKAFISKGFSSFEYYFVDDEEGFIKVLKEKKIDVILSDYQLPDFSGMDALQVVKSQYPRIPFIFVTGKMGEDAAISSLLNGATDYVLKAKPERLVPAINRVLYEAELLQDRIASDIALRESEERYRNLVENISDVIFEVDHVGNIVYVSPVIHKIIGYRPDELVGTKFTNIVVDEDKQSIIDRFLDLKINSETVHEYRCHTKAGDVCWVRTSTKAIFAGGEFIGGSGTLIDITRRKQDELALLKEQYLMQTLMNNIPDHLYFKDLESRFLRISKSNNQSFGLKDSSEAIGKTDFDFFTEEHAQAAYLDEQEIIRTGKPLVKEERETWPDRPDTWALSTKMPLRDQDDNIIGTFGISRDISERKQFEEELLKSKEKAEASDRLKTAFIRNISHEILTPLHGILGFGPMLTDPALTIENRREFLSLVNVSSDRLITTVNNIMDISLVVSGTQEMTISTFAAGKLLSGIREKFSPLCIAKNLQLCVKEQLITSEIQITSDRELIRKILSHLVDNSVKFTKEGSVTIGFESNGGITTFFVSDTGLGMDEATLGRMYEPFMQKEVDINRTHEGSGLGLSIAKGFIELLGGDIRVESVLNEGSTFSFTIPNHQI